MIRPGSGVSNPAPDVGRVYPPEVSEELTAGLHACAMAMKLTGHQCDHYLRLPEGRLECIEPGHEQTAALARTYMDMLGITDT